MIDFIKDLVEEAKVSDNHTAVKTMTYVDMMDAVKKYNNSIEDFNKELSEYMERNGCFFSYVADGTRIPRIMVKYRGFQSDNMFDGAKFGKVYITRDGNKALYITKEYDIHKLCIDNGVVLYYNGDGSYSCFNESDDFEMPKQYRDYDTLKKQISTTMISGVVFSAVLTAICIIFAVPILSRTKFRLKRSLIILFWQIFWNIQRNRKKCY